MDEHDKGMLAGAIFGIAFGLALGVGFTRWVFTTSAIEHGAAKWTIDARTGERKFEWVSNAESQEGN